MHAGVAVNAALRRRYTLQRRVRAVLTLVCSALYMAAMVAAFSVTP